MNDAFLKKEQGVLTEDMIQGIADRLVHVCRELPIALCYLHGSCVDGSLSPLSDVDVAVLLKSDVGRDPRKMFDVMSTLEKAAQVPKLDVVILNVAGPIIADRVVRKGKLLYSNSERTRIVFEAATIKRAFDFAYFSKVFDEALLSQLAEGHVVD